MTVSRAVNTPDQVPAATLAKVQLAIQKTGYVPNLLAGGLRSNKSRLVAALIPLSDLGAALANRTAVAVFLPRALPKLDAQLPSTRMALAESISTSADPAAATRRSTQFSRRNHFHGLGDLAGIFYGHNPLFDAFKAEIKTYDEQAAALKAAFDAFAVGTKENKKKPEKAAPATTA